MPVLQINQQLGAAPNQYRISVRAVEVPGLQATGFSTDIEFALSDRESERIRWYLEDYLQFDEDPAPRIARDVEGFMAARGEHLFRGIFEKTNPGRQLWTMIEPHLSSTRVEITTGIAEATAIPWELIRDPHSETFLAVSAQSFVRTQQESQIRREPQPVADKVRVLLIICRPQGGADVPFRSVVGKLAAVLTAGDSEAFQLDVLRPPTYEQLARVLGLAKEAGRPYHIVHFDGHGMYAEAAELADIGKVLNNLMLKGESTGPRGFLAFENPSNKQNREFVDGFRLGALLRDTSVPVLVLNACQSAFAEAKAEPDESETETTRQEIKAYGSLAQAVMDAGAAGVVAMRYSVYVVTAAQFVAELYGALARGRRLGEAVGWARKNLYDQPMRQIAYDARPLQDWQVPVVWEQTPLRLWPESAASDARANPPDAAVASSAKVLDSALPERPDVGFYGRDETLYALDRAFDAHKIVLLHAFAGSGKTSTAAEFARWYALTGGVQGPVLFSSFERHLPLARVLDKIGELLGNRPTPSGKSWGAIRDPAERRKEALLLLKLDPVLWIWDNVEPVTGFPAGSPSDWSAEEQQELRSFLSAARDTKAKFLLTSRRDEVAWLGDLARRVEVPAMPMLERLQLAGAIVERRSRRLAELPDLTPLLRFTQGNPLTILVAVGEVLRVGIATEAQLGNFVAALQGGQVDFEDEETEGRSKSLGASLSYGFGAINEDDRKVLALLHLFQRFVDIDALRLMGSAECESRLDAVRGLTRERGIKLLDRAAEIGLLNGYSDGYYGIHPALPWYFQKLFAQYFPESTGAADRARQAFAWAFGELGNYYAIEYGSGRRQVQEVVAAQEENLLAAWRIARKFGSWRNVVSAMQGLRDFYEATGRRAAWRLLVNEVVPEFVDAVTGGPREGRDEMWSVVTEYRVFLAMEDRDLVEAERLQRVRVNWNRQNAQAALAIRPDKRNAKQKNTVRSLAVALTGLADVQRGQGSPGCAETYREGLDIVEAIGDVGLQGITAFNLGHAYKDVAELRDLAKAESWYRKSLDLQPASDKVGIAQCLGQLGRLAMERFSEAQMQKRPIEEIKGHLDAAAGFYEQALALIPVSQIADQGIAHNALGVIYNIKGNLDRALHHFQHDIRCCELAGDAFGAGQTRYNVAIAFYDADRFSDAEAYAAAARDDFLKFGDRAAAEIQKAERLLAAIEKASAEKKDGS